MKVLLLLVSLLLTFNLYASDDEYNNISDSCDNKNPYGQGKGNGYAYAYGHNKGSFDAVEKNSNNTNISTKIANKSFTLILSSLNVSKNSSKHRDDDNKSIKVKFQLYDFDTNRAVSDFYDFNISASSTIEKEFIVNGAYKDVRVAFTYCAKNKNNKIKPWSKCEDTMVRATAEEVIKAKIEATKEEEEAEDKEDEAEKKEKEAEEAKCQNRDDRAEKEAEARHAKEEAEDAKEDAKEARATATATENSHNGNHYGQESGFITVLSSDNFAIRPEKFIISEPIDENINLLTSASDYNYSIKATPFNSEISTSLYTMKNANLALIIDKTIFNQDDIEDSNLSGSLTFSSDFNITDGDGKAEIKFDDVGKVNIQIEDRNWAQVDIDNNDTDEECSPTGAYICGDINTTFIPDNFKFTYATLKNADISGFTYISSDLKVSANLDITLEARNADNNITNNFTASWCEHPLSITMDINATDTNLTLNKDDISENIYLGFNSGSISINGDETNSSKKLMFNFLRDASKAQNPFLVNGSEVTLTAKSTIYDSESNETKTISGLAVADESATFIYGRTNAPRQRFAGDSGIAVIYYEAYCYGTGCDKSLLPDGVDSKMSDDPRWFINTKHTSTSGTAGIVSQKRGSYVSETDSTSSNVAKSTLSYNEENGYPYKTTMQNTPDTWLVYNKYKASATTNTFKVEFVIKKDTNSSYVNKGSGSVNTTTTTKSSAAEMTHRRTMW